MLITNDTKKRRTVLIIDDEDLNFFALAEVLKTRDYHCLSATNITEAYTVLKNTPDIHAILMDIMMPGVDGFATTIEIKKDAQYAHIPIIIVSALGGNENIKRSFDAGAASYITKPVNIEQLMESLEQLG